MVWCRLIEAARMYRVGIQRCTRRSRHELGYMRIRWRVGDQRSCLEISDSIWMLAIVEISDSKGIIFYVRAFGSSGVKVVPAAARDGEPTPTASAAY